MKNEKKELYVKIVPEKNEIVCSGLSFDDFICYLPEPIENLIKMGKKGFMGIPFDKKYGGAGLNNKIYIAAVEEISKGCAATGVIMSAHTSLCAWPIYQYGNEKNFMLY